MANVFKKNKENRQFSWASLGDIKEGRGDLGEEMPVLVYRLMQFTMFDVINKDLGREKANYYLREAGRLAGTEFARNTLDLSLPYNIFIAELQKALQTLKIGIMRIESMDEDKNEIILTIAQDLDCSGLPIINDTVCDYDEGFLTGIIELYTGRPYEVREIDCWASGDRVCRFKCTAM